MKRRAPCVAVVEWDDAWTEGDPEPKQADRYPQLSCGWLVESSRKVVRLAQTRNADDNNEDDGGFRDVITIPRALVRKLVRLSKRRT